MRESDCIVPDWPAPANVRALATTRAGGVSEAPFDTLNLGERTGDAPEAVAENRRRLAELLPAAPLWLHQEHGTRVIAASAHREGVAADGCVATGMGQVCVVLTADCLPLLLSDGSGSCVAAVHAGWRGLHAGIVEAAVAALPAPAGELMAWLGPAISVEHYRVGRAFRADFLERDARLDQAFVPCEDGWHADLCAIARHDLARAGLTRVYGGDRCTFGEAATFYSHRRDGATGRQAALVWLEQA